MMSVARARVYDFEDPLEFLKSEFTNRKNLDPNFSVRQWATEMELETPNLLVSLLKGKKVLRLSLLPVLRKGLSLDPTEELYFSTLIMKAGTKNPDEQDVLEKLLQGISPGRTVKAVISKDTEVLSDWATIALLVALEVPEYRTENALASVFQEHLSRDELKSRVELLKEKGLVEDVGGELNPNQQRIATPTDWSNSTIHAYYSTALDLAKAAIPLSVQQREFQCFSVALSSEDLSAYKEMIRQFRTKIASRALHTVRPDAVYQMNMQFFPVTHSASSSTAQTDSKDLEW